MADRTKVKPAMPAPAPAAPRAAPRYVEIVRVSTRGQADRNTPEIQRRALDDLNRVRPGVLVERIEALGVSGALSFDQRDDLKRLLKLAGRYDEVRVYAIDRLTRADDPRERAAVLGLIKDANAVIVDVNGRVTDPADELGETDWFLQSMYAKREHARILKRTLDGKRRALSDGKLVNGRPPMGRRYDRATGEWSIDPEGAALLRRIFDLALSGNGVNQIARLLTAEGVPTEKGLAWAPGTISRLLRERQAIGEYGTMGVTFPIPAVIDPETFDRVQVLIAGNRWKSGPKNSVKGPMLRKLLTCSECGKTMQVLPGGKAGDIRWYYVCASRRDPSRPDCGRKFHSIPAVDAAVRSHLEAMVRDPKRLLEAAGMTETEEHPWADEAAAAERELLSLSRREEKLVRLATKGMVSDDVLDRQTTEIRRLRSAAERELQAAKLGADAAERRKADTGAFDARLRAIVERIDREPTEGWASLAAELFPRRPPYGLKLTPSGEVIGNGLLPLPQTNPDDAGDGTNLGHLSRASGNELQKDDPGMPIRMLARRPKLRRKSPRLRPPR